MPGSRLAGWFGTGSASLDDPGTRSSVAMSAYEYHPARLLVKLLALLAPCIVAIQPSDTYA